MSLRSLVKIIETDINCCISCDSLRILDHMKLNKHILTWCIHLFDDLNVALGSYNWMSFLTSTDNEAFLTPLQRLGRAGVKVELHWRMGTISAGCLIDITSV